MKIGLLGGSFDPIHEGHLAICRIAYKKLDLDEVWLIPTLNNPFKDHHVASDVDRCEMIEIATRKDPFFSVCKIELEGDPNVKSYTVHTLEKLTKLYPNEEFYYFIGDDQVAHFDKWYESKRISELCQLVCFEREGYPLNKDNIKTYHMKRLRFTPSPASSTLVREGHLEYLDKKVARYMSMHGIYLDTQIKPFMSQKRYEHTLRVAKLAKEIANSNGIDELKAYVACMLHDIGKEMEHDKAYRMMLKHYPEHLDSAEPVWHQWLSARLAKKIFRIKDPEILQAIENHTTGSLDMSLLDMVVYCADKYEPGRGFDASEAIAMCKKDIRQGFAYALKDFYEFSNKKNRPIDAIFYEIYKKYGENTND